MNPSLLALPALQGAGVSQERTFHLPKLLGWGWWGGGPLPQTGKVETQKGRWRACHPSWSSNVGGAGAQFLPRPSPAPPALLPLPQLAEWPWVGWPGLGLQSQAWVCSTLGSRPGANDLPASQGPLRHPSLAVLSLVRGPTPAGHCRPVGGPCLDVLTYPLGLVGRTGPLGGGSHPSVPARGFPWPCFTGEPALPPDTLL